MNNYFNEDTICAISTAAGNGAIAVIRISGKDTVTVAKKFLLKDRVEFIHGEMKLFSFFVEGEVLDRIMLCFFKGPNSYTGEDIIEIYCHGSVYIQQEILNTLIANGCRLARAGEFTQRAFLNGKIDLSQAEAVADLIASQSAAAHKMAINQMRGGFSAELQKLRTQLLDFTSLIELELDFSEEDVEFADRKKLQLLSQTIFEKISNLANSFYLGNAIKNGISVAIVGETNVGKSTLLNVLLNEEKAIVSDIHGTTRDAIEDTVNVDGITFRFIDTAGIRQTNDEIENMGIERTYRQIENAEIVLWVVSSAQQPPEAIINRTKGKKLIVVLNKIDLLSVVELQMLQQYFADCGCKHVSISAKNSIGIDGLLAVLLDIVSELYAAPMQDIIVSNVRHYEALKNAQYAISRVIDGLSAKLSGDLLSQDMRECLHFIGEITGEITTDEVLENIFGRFCIGK